MTRPPKTPPDIDTGLLGQRIELAEAMGVEHVTLPLDMVRRIKERILAMPTRSEETRPLPPEVLVSALHDPIGPTSGKLIAAKPVNHAREPKK